MDCIFCKIVRGDIPSFKVWENAEYFAFMDINPMRQGHVLLIPKEHVDYIFDYADPGYSRMFQVAKKLSIAIRDVTGAKKIGIAVEGIAVPHAHIHLVPVNKSNDLDPCLVKPGDKKELAAMAEELRKHLKF